MTTKHFYPFIIITFSFFLIQCGDSPFLNKKESKTTTPVSQQSLSEGLLFTKSKIHIQTYWRSGPFIIDESKLLIILSDKENIPTSSGFEFKAKLWMPDMGHGSYPIHIVKIAEGTYELTDVYFTMGGYWDLEFQLFLNNQLIEEVKWGINI